MQAINAAVSWMATETSYGAKEASWDNVKLRVKITEICLEAILRNRPLFELHIRLVKFCHHPATAATVELGHRTPTRKRVKRRAVKG